MLKDGGSNFVGSGSVIVLGHVKFFVGTICKNHAKIRLGMILD